MSAAEAKRVVRARVRAAIGRMSQAERAEASSRVVEALVSNDFVAAGGAVMLYLPLPDEPDLTPAIARLLASGRVVAVPRVDWTTGAMVASRITAWPADDATGFETTKHMLQQPGADAPTLSAGDIGLIVVPGVAFDDQGGRVGRGKGFYDRFLKGIRERGVLTRVLGVCFGCQVVAQVPTEPHDARVDEVLTDRGFLGVRRPAFKPT